ncbi:MAG: septum formation initiator family protein [Brachybacterium sp.]|nr:septum formation initiator family protein [Brachybacterium sp.]
MAVIVVSLAALVPTLNAYVTQHQELTALQQQVEQQRSDVQDLEAEVARWDDPTFVAAQARERLLFAMPGETQYRLTDTTGADVPLTEDQQQAEQATRDDWFTTLWGSVEGASTVQPDDIPAGEQPEDQDPAE